MAIDKKIPKRLWPFVKDSIVKILNLLLTTANEGIISPYEKFYKVVGIVDSCVKPYIRYLRTYFYDAYYYNKP